MVVWEIEEASQTWDIKYILVNPQKKVGKILVPPHSLCAF
jgi:hypothetical protein